MKTEITLEDYINATNAAGGRVRQIVYLISFASILSFMAYWNSRDTGWINSRFSISEKALGYIYKDSSNKIIAGGPKFTKVEEEKVNQFLSARQLTVTPKFDDLREIYRTLKRETYLIRVPILGISFDINDLGIFSGLTFTFLLTLFWFTLEREEENLKMTFDYAKKENKLKEVYYYLSMGQVLTLPPKTSLFVGKFWMCMPKFLFLSPFVVCLLIFLNDMNTLEAGFVVSQNATITLITTSVIFLTVVTILSILSIYRSFRIDKLWNETFKKEVLPTQGQIL